MYKTIEQLQKGFVSSSGLTPEFSQFYKTFKKEITKELKSIGAENIQIKRGHFYVSGFFTVGGKCFYISLPDVRGSEIVIPKVLYRTAKDYKDFTGGANNYLTIREGMANYIVLN